MIPRRVFAIAIMLTIAAISLMIGAYFDESPEWRFSFSRGFQENEIHGKITSFKIDRGSIFLSLNRKDTTYFRPLTVYEGPKGENLYFPDVVRVGDSLSKEPNSWIINTYRSDGRSWKWVCLDYEKHRKGQTLPPIWELFR
jgi:hypothetical protein